MKLSAFLFVAVLIAVATAAAAIPRAHYKHLAGPPAEFAKMALPQPSQAPTVQFESEYTLVFAKNAQGAYEAQVKLQLDAAKALTLSVLAPQAGKMELSVGGGVAIAKKTQGPFAIDGFSVPSASFVAENVAAGEYTVTVTAAEAPTPAGGEAGAVLLVGEESRFGLYSHASSFDLELDRAVGVTAQLIDASVAGRDFAPGMARPAAYAGATQAAMRVRRPDGTVFSVPMADDGMSNDLLANDGVFGAKVEVESAGQYLMTPVVAGVSPSGRAFQRVAHHIVPVAYPVASLTGIAEMAHGAEADDIVSMFVHVDSDASNEPLPRVRVYAQVWGTPVDAAKHDYVPVAWVQSIEVEQIVDGKAVYQLDLNEAWLQKAGVKAPFQLRAVRLQQVEANTVVSSRDELFVMHKEGAEAFNAKLAARINYAAPRDAPATERMTQGPRPAKYAVRPQAAEGKGKLMLVHGYCSGPVWPVEDFTNAVAFADHTQSRSQDEFAQLILAFGEQFPEGYSIVGHSQGGLAALHLRSFYWSGLDLVSGGRVLQSVGSPYQGCSMAGSLANVGNVFGVGCGSNYDLSPEGAQVWLASIPQEMRQQVYYYTTQYKPGFLADCVTASNLVLYTPNDGTCEVKYSVLEGGNDMGHKEGWCHVTDMKYPPQCSDKSRNAEMDANAAR